MKILCDWRQHLTYRQLIDSFFFHKVDTIYYFSRFPHKSICKFLAQYENASIKITVVTIDKVLLVFSVIAEKSNNNYFLVFKRLQRIWNGVLGTVAPKPGNPSDLHLMDPGTCSG